MSTYKHILVGLDLSPESQQVIDRVKALFSSTTAKISVCHILEPISYTYGGDIPVDLSSVQGELEAQATKRLREMGDLLGIGESQRHIIIGQPAHEMHRLAEDIGADLIVVGSHGRHGLALVFGSTSNSVLHGASCDVLAVRIDNNA